MAPAFIAKLKLKLKSIFRKKKTDQEDSEATPAADVAAAEPQADAPAETLAEGAKPEPTEPVTSSTAPVLELNTGAPTAETVAEDHAAEKKAEAAAEAAADKPAETAGQAKAEESK
ncbi:hypothetical protein BO82DRAFT_358252 [Aspergillus uvarum CBS 121591]|uniref:Uncharacterized protein n=1 Tax=Aspergillus uvarum CBS 121591 TaxID=1448315 RepID=A0A319BXG2_9EURO|nr:hypothetical protein BO82DRAFT_358252 [Aspergillus uvarum CBS 121591]PYH77415.1 hypothetical protein BO82DRAFT_358252 [Aspergillus uvarum CBS 121591]